MRKSLNRKKQGAKGFTLAELLIALAILGVIATFAIPSVLNAQQDSQRRAGLKSAVSAVTSAAYAQLISTTAPLSSQANQAQAILNSMSGTIKCTTATFAAAGGCWIPPAATDTFGAAVPGTNYIGVRLGNGAVIGLWNANENADNGSASTGTIKTVVVDWNGGARPNAVGQDQIYFKVVTGAVPLISAGGVAGESFTNSGCLPANQPINPGSLTTTCTSGSALATAQTTANNALYNQLFTNH